MKDSLSADRKVDVLLHGLDERYKAIHIIRERVQSVCLWTLGLLFAAGGWLIQSGGGLTLSQKGMFLLGLVAVFIVLRFWYLADLEEGFIGQRRAAARLEEALGLFEGRVFDDRNDGVYPLAWREVGEPTGPGRFFVSSYLLLYTGFVFVAACVLLVG